MAAAPPLTVSLIGAPTDVGASVLGASLGPDALRIAGLAQALRAQGLAVHDCGNLPGPFNPQQPAQAGFATWSKSPPGTLPCLPRCKPNWPLATCHC